MTGRIFIAAAAAVTLGATAARADIYINGGADDLVAPALLAEFQIVYAGQHYTTALVGSGPALAGFLVNDCTFGVFQNCNWAGGPTPVHFAVSAIPLTAYEVQSYNNNLGATDGPPIQFPLYAVPIAIVGQEPGIKANGQLAIGDGALCGIISGQLTDWSQFSNSVPAGAFSVVYDTNAGSGATWLLTQHLNAVCNKTNSAFTQLPVPVTANFASLPIPGGVAANSRFVGANGNAGMQAALLSSGSAFGYIGPSYTAIAPKSPATANLYVAALQNSQDLKLYLPTAALGALALHSPGPGAQYTTPPTTQTAGANPVNWVTTNPRPASGYPISGYANWTLSSCYANVGTFLLQYLEHPYEPVQHQAAIANAGLATLTGANNVFAKAVANNLLRNNGGWGINLQNPLTCLNYLGR